MIDVHRGAWSETQWTVFGYACTRHYCVFQQDMQYSSALTHQMRRKIKYCSAKLATLFFLRCCEDGLVTRSWQSYSNESMTCRKQCWSSRSREATGLTWRLSLHNYGKLLFPRFCLPVTIHSYTYTYKLIYRQKSRERIWGTAEAPCVVRWDEKFN